jgi:hypothetical protein
VKARLSADDVLVAVVGTADDIHDKVKQLIPKLDGDVVVAFDTE